MRIETQTLPIAAVAFGALFDSPCGRAADPSPTPINAELLRGKSDQDLLELVTGQKISVRVEFEKLSTEDQTTIRGFVNWMRTVNAPWSCRYIENVFVPHTPRPDILYEQ